MLFLFILITVSIHAAPEKKDVEKSVKDEINYQIKNNENNQYWVKLIQSIFENMFKMRNIKDVFFVLFIFIVCLLVFMLLFFILRNITSINYRSRKVNELEIKNESSVFDMKLLETLINDGDYSGAVLYIHRCSVFYLMKSQMIFNANLTNFTIYMKIADKDLKDSFKSISGVSERILFDGYEAGVDDAAYCRKLFAEFFV